MKYYVTVDGDRVDGPFDDSKEAGKCAAEVTTNEVNLTYLVEAVDRAEE